MSASNSKLSAEAESFVPSQDKPAGEPGALPRYVTSCYPFVQDDPAQQHTQGPAQQNPGRPGGRGYRGNAPQGYVPRYGAGRGLMNRPPAPAFLPTHSPHLGMHFMHNNFLPAQQANMFPGGFVPMGAQQAMLSGHPPPPHNAWGPASQQRFLPPTEQQQAAQRFLHNQHFQQHMSGAGASNAAAGGGAGGELLPTDPVKQTKSKKKKKNDSGMVSVGIQNEGGIVSSSGGSKRKARPKTIICMDAALQTDFADEIKNLTLEEEPSSLYQKDKTNWMEQYQDSSSESEEEVDSDSGYSSPLHRRNLASNGTHPILGVTSGGYTQSQPPQVFTSLGYNYPPPPLPVSAASYPVTAQQQMFSVHNFPPLPPPLLSNMHLAPAHLPPPRMAVGPAPARPQMYMAPPPPQQQSSGGIMAVAPVPMVPPPPSQQPTADPTAQQVTEQARHRSRGRSLSSSSSKPSTEQTASASKTDNETEDSSSTSSKKKRRQRSKHRGRSRTKDSGDESAALSDDPSHSLHRSQSSSNVSRTSTLDNNDILHFEDEDEFPNLLSAANGLVDKFANPASQSALSYSDILKSQVSPLSQESNISFSSSEHFRDTSGMSSEQKKALSMTSKESKNARKRRKRRELANKAAEEELAEISIEQEVLKEIRTKHFVAGSSGGDATQAKPSSGHTGGRKSQQPLSINIADMILALENPPSKQPQHSTSVVKKPPINPQVANLLDSSAPVKRGKERENPKAKKPSPLKKVILKEREERKRLRLYPDGVEESLDGSVAGDEAALAAMQAQEDLPLDDAEAEAEGDEELTQTEQEEAAAGAAGVCGEPVHAGGGGGGSDLSQDAGSTISMLSSKASSLDYSLCTPVSADMSPISQTSPISMSPLSGSPLSSGIHSPIAGNLAMGGAGGAGAGYYRSSIINRIHSRRFREYCNQVLDKDIDQSCTLLLQDLVRFQDRLFHKDPIKSKSKRRIVLGLREVTKHLKLKKIRCVIISPNLERIQSKGGLDETLNNIIDMCHEQDVPLVFALGRRALGRACAKLVPVSVVGIFSYEGSEEHFKRLIELTHSAQSAYMEMVNMLEKDGGAQSSASSTSSTTNPAAGTSSSTVAFPLFTHMGHSRTPSACSAISFTSSILSEPISENYPHSEPETDSRGYEIVKVKTGAGAGTVSQQQQQQQHVEQDEQSESTNSSNLSHSKVITVENLDYEADTEEDPGSVRRRKDTSSSRQSTEVSLNGFYGKGEESNEDDIEDEAAAAVQDLPHIDSIHSSVVDLSAEILSQHSSKTVDTNVDVLSTHSSKTLEGGACAGAGRMTPDRTSSTRNMGSAPDLRSAAADSSGGAGQTGSNTPVSQKSRTLDKERIESWVAETQKQIESLNVNGGGSSVSSSSQQEEDVQEQEELAEEIVDDDDTEHDNDNGLDFTKSQVLSDKLSPAAVPASDSNSNNILSQGGGTTDSNGLMDVAPPQR